MKKKGNSSRKEEKVVYVYFSLQKALKSTIRKIKKT